MHSGRWHRLQSVESDREGKNNHRLKSVLLNNFKINPLRRCAVLLFCQSVNDHYLQHILARLHARAELYRTTAAQSLKICLVFSRYRKFFAYEDRLAVAEQAYLGGELR